jgi:hypothetical protein
MYYTLMGDGSWQYPFNLMHQHYVDPWTLDVVFSCIGILLVMALGIGTNQPSNGF